MTYSLNTIVLDPASKNKPKNAVILCHGYGGDGKDISILATYWRAHLPDTIFICPDAPEKCAASPSGFQWFDLMDQTSEQVLAKSLVAENKLNKLFHPPKGSDLVTQASAVIKNTKSVRFSSDLHKPGLGSGIKDLDVIFLVNQTQMIITIKNASSYTLTIQFIVLPKKSSRK